jgi:hypothetical protein
MEGFNAFGHPDSASPLQVAHHQEVPSFSDVFPLSTSPETVPAPSQAGTHSITPSLQTRLSANPHVPEPLLRGAPMIKISNRKVKQRIFRLEEPEEINPTLGELVGDRRGIEGYATICWESRKVGRGT